MPRGDRQAPSQQAINAQYEGTDASYRLPPEKRIYLSHTFVF